MAPLLFWQLGAPVNNFFGGGYYFGLLSAFTNTQYGRYDIETESSQNLYTQKVSFGLNVKYTNPSQGITLIEKCSRDKTFSSEVIVVDKFRRGLKLGLQVGSSFVPFLGKRNAKISGEYRHNNFSVDSDLVIEAAGGPIFNLSGVVGFRKNWYLGYQTAFDISQLRITKSNFALRYDGNGFILHAIIKSATEFGFSALHNVNYNLKLAARMNCKNGQDPTFDVGATYSGYIGTTIRCKIDSDSKLCFSVSRKVAKRLWATGSVMLNLPTIAGGGHMCGMYLQYDWPS